MINHNPPSPSKLVSLSLYVDFYARSILWRKMYFWLVTSVKQRKNSESPWGIKPQTFGFHNLMLYHWATETLWWARPIVKLIYVHIQHLSCILLGSAMLLILAVNAGHIFFVPHLWQDKKTSLPNFLYQALNLSSSLFYLQYILGSSFQFLSRPSFQTKQYKAISNDRKN